MGSPTSRSLEQLRREGWVPGVVERHNTFSNKKTDYIGIIDIIAVNPGISAGMVGAPHGATLGVQACAGSGGDSATRVAKALREWRVLAWLLAGNGLEVWSWAKRTGGVRGGRKRWMVRRVPIRLSDDGVRDALARAVRVAWAEKDPHALAAFPPGLWADALAVRAA